VKKRKSLEDLVAMISHDPENLNPCEKKKKSIEDLVGMSTHDPENLNPCEEKKIV
jgi:hypothetical protein